MKGPVIHLTKAADAEVLFAYLYVNYPKMRPGLTLETARKCFRFHDWPETGRDIYAFTNIFDSCMHPVGISHGDLTPVNSISHFKRHLRRLLA